MKNKNNAYGVKHKRQNLCDWQKDIHRFKFFYNGEKEVCCVGGLDVFFDDKDIIPEEVKKDITEYIWKLMDKELAWSVPKGAREIAEAYCKEEFLFTIKG